MSDNIIEVRNLYKSFTVGKQQIPVLKDLNVDIPAGDFAIITGPSGCGKSTFLHIILGLEPPSEGTINFLGQNLYDGTDEDARSDFRKHNIGMVYQQANWIKALTVLENVAFPWTLLGYDDIKAYGKAEELLRQVGLFEWRYYIPTELSSGQQQRVSLARALVNDPKIIIADEPTGNLDYASGQQMMELLRNLNRDTGKAVIMVTHDLEYIKYAKSTVQMFDGEVVNVYRGADKDKILSEIKNFKKEIVLEEPTNVPDADNAAAKELKEEQEVKQALKQEAAKNA